jgi:putative pyoverdin transport system ATP-binding/permease protein
MRIIGWLLNESIVRFVLACVASVTAGLLTLAVLILLFRLVGESNAVRLELYVALSLGAIASRVLARRLIESIGRNAISFLRMELFRRIVTAPLADIERIGRSKLIMALTDDVGRIAAIVPNLVVLCTNLTLIIAYLAYLAWLSVIQFGIIVLVIGIGLICHFLLRREGTAQVRVSQQKRNDLLDVFRSALDSVKELKLHAARREQILGAFADRSKELQVSVERQSVYFGGSAMVVQILFYVALGLVMFDYVGDAGGRHLTVSYGVAILYLMGPLRGSIQTFQELAAADIALDRVEELGLALDRAKEKQRTSDAVGSTVARSSSIAGFDIAGFRHLELLGVTYSYSSNLESGGGGFILGPVDVVLARGEIVFVVGGNGSGKTTFVKLVAGLYAPTAGLIRVNDREVTGAESDWYCQCFSAIFHDFFVFERLLGNYERLGDLLRRFGMAERITVEGDKIVEPSSLSLGERKRLALMFAYIDDKPVVILDEWAADQDPEFKEVFYNQILEELRDRGKLVIVISHDDRYFHLADKVLRFDRGHLSLLEGARAGGIECAFGTG